MVEPTYETTVDGAYIANTVRFTITNTSAGITVGQRLQVYGVLTGDRTVRATSSITVPGRNRQVMYLVSFLAGL